MIEQLRAEFTRVHPAHLGKIEPTLAQLDSGDLAGLLATYKFHQLRGGRKFFTQLLLQVFLTRIMRQLQYPAAGTGGIPLVAIIIHGILQRGQIKLGKRFVFGG